MVDAILTACTPASDRARSRTRSITCERAVRHTRRGWRPACEQQPIVGIPWIAAAGADRRAREDSTCREQRQRQRHLSDHHQVARAKAASHAPALRAEVLQIADKVTVGQLHGRPEPERHRAQRGKRDRHREHRAIRHGVEDDRHRKRRGEGHAQRTRCPVAEDQSDRRANAGQHQALGEQLPDNARAPRPMASRTASSRRRDVPRASSMLAMLRQAMTSTMPDRPISSAVNVARPRSSRGAGARPQPRQIVHRQRLILVLAGIGRFELPRQRVELRRDERLVRIPALRRPATTERRVCAILRTADPAS